MGVDRTAGHVDGDGREWEPLLTWMLLLAESVQVSIITATETLMATDIDQVAQLALIWMLAIARMGRVGLKSVFIL